MFLNMCEEKPEVKVKYNEYFSCLKEIAFINQKKSIWTFSSFMRQYSLK